MSSKNPQLKKKESHGIGVSEMQYFLPKSEQATLLPNATIPPEENAWTVSQPANKPSKVPKGKIRVKNRNQSPGAITDRKENALTAQSLR